MKLNNNMKLFSIALGSLFILNTASAAVVDNISVPGDVQEHVNYITKNCDVRTHLTERIEADKLGGVVTDSLRNVDRVVRSCDDGTFGFSRKIWDDYHSWHFNLENTGQMLPVFTDTAHQASYFVGTGRYFFAAK